MDVPQAPLWELVEGAQGVAPKPSFQRGTTIENEGGTATPPHHYRRPKQPDATSRHNVAMVDGEMIVGSTTTSLRSRISLNLSKP